MKVLVFITLSCVISMALLKAQGAVLSNETLHLQNLDDHCMRCLCYAATENCNLATGCKEGKCGAFGINKLYWIDAGKPTLPEDDVERSHAWEDCALNYHCATRIVLGYLQALGRDCNNDGVTNCFDYAMINANGGWHCEQPLDRSEKARSYLKRYQGCVLSKLT